MKKQKKVAKKTAKQPLFKIAPLGERVLVREIKDESGSQTKSGIIIPETISEDKGSKKGKVVAVGEGRFDDGKLVPMSVSVGDVVLFQWGDLIKVDGEEYYIVGESNVIAIVN